MHKIALTTALVVIIGYCMINGVKAMPATTEFPIEEGTIEDDNSTVSENTDMEGSELTEMDVDEDNGEINGSTTESPDMSGEGEMSGEDMSGDEMPEEGSGEEEQGTDKKSPNSAHQPAAILSLLSTAIFFSLTL